MRKGNALRFITQEKTENTLVDTKRNVILRLS